MYTDSQIHVHKTIFFLTLTLTVNVKQAHEKTQIRHRAFLHGIISTLNIIMQAKNEG